MKWPTRTLQHSSDGKVLTAEQYLGRVVPDVFMLPELAGPCSIGILKCHVSPCPVLDDIQRDLLHAVIE